MSPNPRIAAGCVAALVSLAGSARGADPTDSPRWEVAARTSAINLGFGGVSLGAQVGARPWSFLHVGLLGEWGGLKEPRDLSEMGCNGDVHRSECVGPLSLTAAYASLHQRSPGWLDPHFDLLTGVAFREVRGGPVRTDLAVGAGAGVDFHVSRVLFVGPGVSFVWMPTNPGEGREALLVTLRAGVEF